MQFVVLWHLIQLIGHNEAHRTRSERSPYHIAGVRHGWTVSILPTRYYEN